METRLALAASMATLLTSIAIAGPPPTPGYRIFNQSGLGGTDSAGNSVNNLGLVAGYSNLADDQTRHATLWFLGFRHDLRTLGGPNSNVVWPVKNLRGVVVGISQTNSPEPLGETWSCRSFFPLPTRSGYTCLGFVWEGGEMKPLPTLGGNNGFATGANNRGQIIGWAENEVFDSTCVAPQRLQFRAVVYGPGRKQLRELPPFDKDTTSAATALNDKGQIVGISGICGTAVGALSAAHAVIWENGVVHNLGSLGGIAWNTPMSINERGDVVGFSNFRKEDGAAFNARAFLWTKTRGIQDLGTLPGDATSQALGINNRGQVVGTSCNADFSLCRAFLWQDGHIVDLNERVPSDYRDLLLFANDINDLGVITGATLVTDTQAQAAFVGVPRLSRDAIASDESAAVEVRAASARSRSVVLPQSVRQGILQRLGIER
jgi:probable HAF family extracellular repeat protein